MSAPAVYRNPRYEWRIAQLMQALEQLGGALEGLSGLVAMQGELIGRLARAQDIEVQMPALPEVRGRAFGMGH